MKTDTALWWRAVSRETDLSLANQNPGIRGQQVQREIKNFICIFSKPVIKAWILIINIGPYAYKNIIKNDMNGFWNDLANSEMPNWQTGEAGFTYLQSGKAYEAQKSSPWLALPDQRLYLTRVR